MCIRDSLDIFSDDYIENPEDAHIEIKDGKYNVIEEKNGCTPIYDSILAEVKDALDNELPKLSLSDDCYEAVSYTHLDVYKRQILRIRNMYPK